MVYNLKKLANFFKLLFWILEKLFKTGYSLFFHEKIISYFPPGVLASKSNFKLKKGFLVKYLSCFGEQTSQSP